MVRENVVPAAPEESEEKTTIGRSEIIAIQHHNRYLGIRCYFCLYIHAPGTSMGLASVPPQEYVCPQTVWALHRATNSVNTVFFIALFYDFRFPFLLSLVQHWILPCCAKIWKWRAFWSYLDLVCDFVRFIWAPQKWSHFHDSSPKKRQVCTSMWFFMTPQTAFNFRSVNVFECANIEPITFDDWGSLSLRFVLELCNKEHTKNSFSRDIFHEGWKCPV